MPGTTNVSPSTQNPDHLDRHHPHDQARRPEMRHPQLAEETGVGRRLTRVTNIAAPGHTPDPMGVG